MQYKEILKKIIGTLAGAAFVARPFLSSGGFLVYPFGGLITEMQLGVHIPALTLFVAVAFNLTHISLGALLISLGFEEAKKFRKPLFISTILLFAVSSGLVAYLFGH